jgi:hypothetical protein
LLPAANDTKAKALFATPVPTGIKFEQTALLGADGKPLYKADLPAHGPFFLEALAHQQIISWAQGAPSPLYGNRKLLVLTGPVKSGKSTLLNTVLPHVLAEQQQQQSASSCKRKIPVIFEHSFSLQEGPQDAALALVEAAGAKARSLGFSIESLPTTTGELAFASLPRVFKELAAGIAALGGELILLIDEAQVRKSRRLLLLLSLLLLSRSVYDAILVASSLPSMMISSGVTPFLP